MTEIRHNEIVKTHKNGDREVSYEITGKRSLTLDEDLAGLDEAYKTRLFDTEYRETATSIMEHARELTNGC